MNIVHLMASPFFGGPERQVLGLAEALPPRYRTTFLSFAERGLSEAFLNRARAAGFEGVCLNANFPHIFRAAREVAGHLRRLRADVLCCSGYKPDIVGYLAARRSGIPVVAIAHGWTAATLRVRVNEAIDRLVMRRMDCVVSVSEAQAVKVRRAGVRPERVVVIRNALRTAPLAPRDPACREELQKLFTSPRQRIVVAAGRLSPEKGFDGLVNAAALVARQDPTIGFVVFGDGPLRQELARQIAARELEGSFVLAGFRGDVERYLPACDLAVLSSHREGLPVAVLEGMAAGLPVVATAVGGVPEVIDDGVHGYLVPPADPTALARRILDVLGDEASRQKMGQRGRARIESEFTFAIQAEAYTHLFERLQSGRAGSASDRSVRSPVAPGSPTVVTP